MKAVVLSRLNEPLEVITGIEHASPGPGQVLVKLAFSGVCHSQLMEVRGRRGVDAYLPHLLGHEGTGKVIEVGAGVQKVKPGEFVVKGSGLDGGGMRYRCACLPQQIKPETGPANLCIGTTWSICTAESAT